MTTDNLQKPAPTSIVTPRILKGFKDYPPQVMLPRVAMIQKLQHIFGLHGFPPIDTPALEYSEILLGKGSQETDKQLFRFSDQGGRDVAMRFDLTVPLARFISMYHNELGTPFRRYHIAPVWRAEKPQKGRFREFLQCDFDIIGSHSIVADAEVIHLTHSALKELGVQHVIRINNRRILNGLLEELQIQERASSVLRAIDKLDKLGISVVAEELCREAELDEKTVTMILEFLSFSELGKHTQKLFSKLDAYFQKSALGREGLNQLRTLTEILTAFGIPPDSWQIDLNIARGLDYYTGTVFETMVTELPGFGSVCSGGRYDDLTGVYMKNSLPGVGGSIGLDRLLAALEELNRLPQRQTSAIAMIALTEQLEIGPIDTTMELTEMEIAGKAAFLLRSAGVSTEIYPAISSLKAQLKYANRRQFKYAIFVNREVRKLNVKNLVTGEQYDNLAPEELPAVVCL